MYVNLGQLKSFMLGTGQPLSLHLGNCRVMVPIKDYPPTHLLPHILRPLVEAEMKTLTREPDVTLTWSKIDVEVRR